MDTSSNEAANPFSLVQDSCCTPSTLHEDLTKLLTQYDVNEAAASVKVYALKPQNS